ncbi:hypothetical protein G4B88_031305 [Cannabis sativa]|uniref:Uncharacterized protein n=1 Tax=Cannabis sativa TaxID=3483 RepID=A0A7J6F0C0_CANSA|nr:hypothetical protein G4B88_031305 [Cannabis sativa]
MAVISNTIQIKSQTPQISYGSPLKRSVGSLRTTNLSFDFSHTCVEKPQLSISRKSLIVQAAYSDSGRPSSASIFVGGFVLGGIIIGTLGCVCAPQISKALTATDGKDLMRKLPKFIYNEEKALEKTRKILAQKIAQLNCAIDEVSSQLRSEDDPIGVVLSSSVIETTPKCRVKLKYFPKIKELIQSWGCVLSITHLQKPNESRIVEEFEECHRQAEESEAYIQKRQNVN